MLLSILVRNSKKSKFIKKQEAKGLQSSLGRKTPLNKVPLLGPFCFKSIQQVNTRYKIYEIVNKFLLAGDKVMSEMHLWQLRFISNGPQKIYACGPFTKNKERIKSLKKQEIQDIFIKTDQTKLVFNMIWFMEILKI